ncbi:MAG: mycothiol synthase [Propionibacteriaceae bacterium]|nr:mycothiol synthase [Propionibacteriaceae bacterium]
MLIIEGNDIPVSAEDLPPSALDGSSRWEAVLDLARQADTVDGVFPFNEDATLSPDKTTHLLAFDAGRLVGCALVGSDSSAQMVVGPEYRRRHVATQLLARMDPHSELWAFGDLPAAQGFCAAQGFEPVRGLLVMDRPPTPLEDNAKTSSSPARISAYVPDDLGELVQLNARVFSAHPEQGHLTIDDFRARIASPWFDPAGLLIARDVDGAMVGFHWTKAEDGIGEVYVLGVDPDHAGSGLGRRLLNVGLAYLDTREVTVIRLWVEWDNTIARNLYEASGFSVVRRDLRYRKV